LQRPPAVNINYYTTRTHSRNPPILKDPTIESFSSKSTSNRLAGAGAVAALALAIGLIGTTSTLLTTSYNDLFSFKNPVALGLGLETVYADTDSTAVGHYSDASTSTSKTSTSETSELDKQYPDAHRYASKEVRREALANLRTLFPSTAGGSQLSTHSDELMSHAQAGGTHHHPHTPDVVVYVESTEDVVKCVRWAGRWGVPVVPYSGESFWTRCGSGEFFGWRGSYFWMEGEMKGV